MQKGASLLEALIQMNKVYTQTGSTCLNISFWCFLCFICATYKEAVPMAVQDERKVHTDHMTTPPKDKRRVPVNGHCVS